MLKYIVLGVALLGWVLTSPASAQYSAEDSEVECPWGVVCPDSENEEPDAGRPSAACSKEDSSEYEHPNNREVEVYDSYDEFWVCDYASKDNSGNLVFDQRMFDAWSQRDNEWFAYR